MKKNLPSRIMKSRTTALIICLLAGIISMQIAFGQIPAFPGAEGFGSTTPGGRGGTVRFVTNLNDAGPGSLREALEASGPRIVIFRVAGTIFLQTLIIVSDPYLTIAGQTAPGDGITIANESIRLKTHDVIVRGIRCRPGDLTGFQNPLDIEGMLMLGGSDPVYKVILDHCSFSWGIDKNVTSFGPDEAFGDVIRDITIQWCISGEALHSQYHPDGTSHAMGMDFSSILSASSHHNLLAHNHGRQPQFSKYTTGESINNIVYNYGQYATEVQTEAKVNIIGNYYKTGLDWSGNSVGIKVDDPDAPYGPVSVYVQGNVGPGRPIDEGNEWDAVNGDEAYRSFSPPTPLSGVITNTATDAYELALANAGVFPRDSVDKRIIYDVVHGTGHKIESQSDVGGWPVLAPGTSPLDSDNDGMPNTWEIANGLNPNSASDGNGDLDGDGYTNVEEYINGLIVPHGTLPYAGENQILCGVTTATLDGNLPLLGTGIWRVLRGGASIVSPTNPNSTVSNLAIGVNEFEWRITYSGSTARDTVQITVDAAPTPANAGTDQTLCNLATATLSGNTPAIGSGLWRVLEGSATITDPDNPSTTATGLQVGLNEFEWAITSTATCPPSRDTVVIDIDALPTVADAGLDELVCNSSSEALNANRAVVGTGHWNVLVGPAVVEDPSDDNSDVSGLQIGENQFEWVITNETCPPSRDTVTITRQSSPTSDYTYVINGLEVRFTSTATNASTYFWTFGDGTTSTQQNPIHTYSVIRSYRVTHQVSNVCGTATRSRRISLSGTEGVLTLTPAGIDFGQVAPKSTSSATVVISNSGSDTLDVEFITIDNPAFSHLSNLGDVFSLGPETVQEVLVTFKGDSPGTYTGSMVIRANDTTGTVPLTAIFDGEGKDFNSPLSVGAVDFGPVEVGNSTSRVVTLTNNDKAPLTVESVSLPREKSTSFAVQEMSALRTKSRTVAIAKNDNEGANQKARTEDSENSGIQTESVSALPLVLESGEALNIVVEFLAEGERSDTTTLSIRTSRGEQPVLLTGTGITTHSTRNDAGPGPDSVETAGQPQETQVPQAISLLQNYPNPFNNTTMISYALKEESYVSIKIYNYLGEEVATLVDGVQKAGTWQLPWNGKNKTGQSVSSGVYVYRMHAGNAVIINRLVVIR